MSTTFGIPIRIVDESQICDGDGELHDYIDTSFFERVFFRGANSRWMNEIAYLLPNNTRIYPLDNSAQGIYTIGDAKSFLQTKHD
jgi:hypothetical protein